MDKINDSAMNSKKNPNLKQKYPENSKTPMSFAPIFRAVAALDN